MIKPVAKKKLVKNAGVFYQNMIACAQTPQGTATPHNIGWDKYNLKNMQLKKVKLFEQFLLESEEDKKAELTDLAKRVEDAVKSVFPKSHAQARVSSSESLFLSFSLAANKQECTNGIIQNDPAFGHIWIYRRPDNTYSVEAHTFGNLMVKPPEGSHLAYGRVKLGWRNFSGVSADAVVKKMTQAFEKAKAIMIENLDRMYPRDREICKADEKLGLK